MSRKRKTSQSKGVPEPLNTLMDLAGAAVLEGIVKNQVKKDIRDGKGKESVRAARLVFGSGAVRGGSRGIINLGGLRGVDKAISEVQREEMPRQSQAPNYAAPVDGFPVRTFVNDNRYAWRLNCEDGSAYGIVPEDYETRREYNEVLQKAKERNT